MEFFHHIYTSDKIRGYQSVVVHQNLKSDLQKLEEQALYKRPMKVHPDDIDLCPSKYKYYQLPDGRQVFSKSTYIGPDYHSGRPGNFCTHSLVAAHASQIIHPIYMFLGEDFWVNELTPEEQFIWNQSGKSQTPVTISFDEKRHLNSTFMETIFSFMSQDSARLKWFLFQINHLIQQFVKKEELGQFILEDEEIYTKYWMFTTIAIFPTHIAKDIHWSSYANPPKYENVHFMGIIPENNFSEKNFNQDVKFVRIGHQTVPEFHRDEYVLGLEEYITEKNWKGLQQLHQTIENTKTPLSAFQLKDCLIFWKDLQALASVEHSAFFMKKYEHLKTKSDLTKDIKNHFLDSRKPEVFLEFLLKYNYVNENIIEEIKILLPELEQAAIQLNVSDFLQDYSSEDSFYEWIQLLLKNTKQLKVTKKGLSAWKEKLKRNFRAITDETRLPVSLTSGNSDDSFTIANLVPKEKLQDQLRELQNLYQDSFEELILELDRVEQVWLIIENIPLLQGEIEKAEVLDTIVELLNELAKPKFKEVLEYKIIHLNLAKNVNSIIDRKFINFSDEELIKENKESLDTLLLLGQLNPENIIGQLIKGFKLNRPFITYHNDPGRLNLEDLFILFEKKKTQFPSNQKRNAIFSFISPLEGKVKQEILSGFICHEKVFPEKFDDFWLLYQGLYGNDSQFKLENRTEFFNQYFSKKDPSKIEFEDYLGFLTHSINEHTIISEESKSYCTNKLMEYVLKGPDDTISKLKGGNILETSKNTIQEILIEIYNRYNQDPKLYPNLSLDQFISIGDYLESIGLIKDQLQVTDRDDLVSETKFGSYNIGEDIMEFSSELTYLLKKTDNKIKDSTFTKLIHETLKKGWEYKDWQILLDTLGKKGINNKYQVKLMELYLEKKKSGKADKKYPLSKKNKDSPPYSYLRNQLLVCCLLSSNSNNELKTYMLDLTEKDLSELSPEEKNNYITRLSAYLQCRTNNQTWMDDVGLLAQSIDVEIPREYPDQELF